MKKLIGLMFAFVVVALISFVPEGAVEFSTASFMFLGFLKTKNISDESFEKMTAEEKHELYKEFDQEAKERLEKAVKDGVEEEAAKLRKEIEEKAAEAEKALTEKAFEQGKAIKAAMENLTKTSKNTKVSLVEEIAKNKGAIIKMSKLQPGAGEVMIKALTNRAAIADNEGAIDLPEIDQLAHKKLTMYETLPKITVGTGTHNGTVRYYDWDRATTVSAAAMVAEGAAFPESTAKFQKYSKDLKKIGDTLPVTEEFFEDEVLFAGELEMFLRTNVDIIINAQLTVGDDTGENLEGFYTAATTYTPVASGITDASIYDLVVKVAEDITTNYGSRYSPNVAYMNISDINKYRLKKDGNNNYVSPPFVSADGRNIDGIIIIENNDILANTMAIGDNRYARVYEQPGTALSRGYKGDQFVEDEITLKARRRMLLLVKNQDRLGLRKVTSISAALTTLAS